MRPGPKGHCRDVTGASDPCAVRLNISRGQSLYSEVQVEQVLSCLGEGSLYSEVQVEQVLSCLGEGSLYSEVQVE